jgi:hypothetical protein
MLTPADFRNGELRFSYCGTEIIYRLSSQKAAGLTLSREQSEHLFARDGAIRQLVIDIN